MRSTRIAPGRHVVIATVVEQIALAVWIGSLVGFAFFFAPMAFHAIPSLDTFARLTGTTLGQLEIVGYLCGGLALLAIFVRTTDALDRTADLVRVALILAALGTLAYESRVVVPAMNATLLSFDGSFDRVSAGDPRRVAYRGLHAQSTRFYGVVVFFGLVTIGIAAARRMD